MSDKFPVMDSGWFVKLPNSAGSHFWRAKLTRKDQMNISGRSVVSDKDCVLISHLVGGQPQVSPGQKCTSLHQSITASSRLCT